MSVIHERCMCEVKFKCLIYVNMETSLKLVGRQTLIYCGDVFGELDMPGCAELYRSKGGGNGRYYVGAINVGKPITI